MPIKGLTEARRLPRLGKIRLGIKKKSPKSGKEYPAEIDYFRLDPQTPSEEENQKLLEEFAKIYGEQPKQIRIMFPVAQTDVIFPQFYKRYGLSTSLQCIGDGTEAQCATEEFTKDLQVIGKNELGNPTVRCQGRECPYYKKKACSEVATLQVLLPEMPGAGVWQITTGSINSIININSCLDFVKAVAGRVNMIPLTLERRETEITYEGKKAKHYLLHINMNFKLADLQKLATIDPEKIAMELPRIEHEKEDIVYQENREVNPPQAGPQDELIKWKTWINNQFEAKKDTMTGDDIARIREYVKTKSNNKAEIMSYLEDVIDTIKDNIEESTGDDEDPQTDFLAGTDVGNK